MPLPAADFDWIIAAMASAVAIGVIGALLLRFASGPEPYEIGIGPESISLQFLGRKTATKRWDSRNFRLRIVDDRSRASTATAPRAPIRLTYSIWRPVVGLSAEAFDYLLETARGLGDSVIRSGPDPSVITGTSTNRKVRYLIRRS
ncbi:MAG: hypothetical protein L3K17_09270 [Thermoplasmata archaeon]|nr:hypothetical protein [Thermoplasmata archaeon]